MIKRPFTYVIDQELRDYTDLCDDSDLRTEVFAVRVADDAERTRGMRRPTSTDDCQSATAVASSASLWSWDSIVLLTFDVEYVDECLGLSKRATGV